MRFFKEAILCLFFLNIPLLAYAQDEDLKKHPGYVDLSAITIPDKASNVTEIFLGPALLKIATMAEGGEDEEIAAVLAGLHGIQVKTFEVEPTESGEIIPIIDRIEKRLKGEGWERLVLVKEEEERVVVSVKSDGEKVVGLLVMAFDPNEEAAFVNIVGTIDFKTLESLDINLDDSVLDSLKSHAEKKERKRR